MGLLELRWLLGDLGGVVLGWVSEGSRGRIWLGRLGG